MTSKLVATVATVALAVGMAGVAQAQQNPTDQQKHPGVERMEKGAPGENAGQRRTDAMGAEHKQPAAAEQTGQAEPKRENEMKAGQAAQAQKRADEKQTGQAEATEKRAEEKQTGQAQAAEKRAEEKRTGQAEATEKRAEEKQTGQAQATEKRAEEKRTGQAEATEKRAEEKRTGQAEATEKRTEEQRAGQMERNDNRRDAAAERKADAAHAHAVRVEGNLKISQERAERLSAELMRRARPENVNVTIDVGARLPDDVVLEPLPADIVEMAPEYRGYDYVYVNDQIVFVQPTSHEVVGMIDVGDNAMAQDEPRLSRPKPCPVD